MTVAFNPRIFEKGTNTYNQNPKVDLFTICIF